MTENPIQIGNAGPELAYAIPEQYLNTMIYLTIKVKILDNGWKYNAVHDIYLGKENLYPDNRKEPQDLKLGYGKDIKSKKLVLISAVYALHNGSTKQIPRVHYELILEAGDTLLDSFEIISDKTNPVSFYTQFKFK